MSRKVFGQNRGGGSNYQRQMGTKAVLVPGSSEADAEAARRAEYKRRKQLEGEALDEKFQFQVWDYKTQGATPRRGWVLNMIPTVCSISSFCTHQISSFVSAFARDNAHLCYCFFHPIAADGASD